MSDSKTTDWPETAEVVLAGDPLALLDSKLLADYVAWKQAADDADELLASIRLLPVD